MSITTSSYVRCDDCQIWHDAPVGLTPAEARRAARRDGWRKIRRAGERLLDLCPSCNQARLNREPPPSTTVPHQ